jgi:hypothetical protein
VSKLSSTALLVLISVLELIRFGMLDDDDEVDFGIVGADYAASGVKLATYLLELALIFGAKRAGTFWLGNRVTRLGGFRPLGGCLLWVVF